MNAKIITTLSAAILVAGIFAQPASATRIKRHEVKSVENCVTIILAARFAVNRLRWQRRKTESVAAPASSRVAAPTTTGVAARSYASAKQDTTIIGGRPAGCPHAYCGCGLAKFLGLDDPRLNLAWNWVRYFPRESAPRAGLAAVSHAHVMYIEGSAGDGLWLIRDYNSGGGLSRLHVRDVRGYVFVNPHSQMAAR